MAENQKIDSKSLGRKVKAVRITMSKTQEEFAEMIDVDVKTVVNIEKGHVIPQMQTMYNIAQKSDKTIDDFIGIG